MNQYIPERLIKNEKMPFTINGRIDIYKMGLKLNFKTVAKSSIKGHKMKLLTVIIVTYNSQDIIADCLDNLFLYNDIGDGLEVIVVDNSDEAVNKKMFEMLSYKYASKVKLIKNEENLGYGHGNNVGIKGSTAKYIAIMNPDILMTEALFSSAINKFEHNNGLALLGYKQIGGKDLSFYYRPEYFIPIFDSFLTHITNKMNFFNKRAMYLSGAFMFIQKKCFEQIGMFDENIFLYNEETDITKRFLLNDMDIKFNKEKSYFHDIRDRNEISLSINSWNLKSKVYYLQKYKFNVERFFKKNIIDLLSKKALYMLLNNKSKIKYYDESIMQYKSFIPL